MLPSPQEHASIKGEYISHELKTRAHNAVDAQQEKLALQDLAACMADHPEDILPRLVDLALHLTGSVSGGVSLIEELPAPGQFRWHALRGVLAPFDGGVTPRHDSPCGIVLEQRAPVLVRNPERLYGWMAQAGVELPEVLLVPLYVGGADPQGALWIVAEEAGHFDGGHARVLTELASFVDVALRMLRGEQRVRQALEKQDLLIREVTERTGERESAEEVVGRLTARSEQQRRLYETILSNTPDFAYVFDLDHRFTYANGALLKMWGRSWEDAVGKNCLEIGYEPWHAAMHDEEIERVKATKQPIRGEVPFNGSNGRRIYDYIFVPVIGPDGEVEAIAGTTRDITERKAQEDALLENEERFRAMVNASSDVLYQMSADWSEMRHLDGRDSLRDTHEPNPAWMETHIHPEDQPQVSAAIDEAIRTRSAFALEHRVLRADGTPGWNLTRAVPIMDAQGEVKEWFAAATDVTVRKAHEEHQKLLIDELNHRVKNTLAVVQSMATQTLRNSSDTEQARALLDARLMALSKAHDTLTRENWEGAPLISVATEAIAGCAGPLVGRFAIGGPDVWLPPKHALALAMALHELCTNAMKYGALSNEHGTVDVVWDLTDGVEAEQLVIRWEEKNGPPVTPPTRRGFGSRLVERGLKHDLGGDVHLGFAPGGVVCSITAPLGHTGKP